MVFSGDTLLKRDGVLQSALQGQSPCAGQGLWNVGRIRSTGHPLLLNARRGLDGEWEEVGAPLPFTPRHTKAVAST